jgi:cell division septation protein DedD
MRERRPFENDQNSYMSENKLFVIFAVVTFLIFVALALFAYSAFIKGQESSEVVLIKADEQPYKVTPEDPGGMKVNYQDKEVFNTLVGKENTNAQAPQEMATLDEPMQPLSPEEVMRKAEKATGAQLADNSLDAPLAPHEQIPGQEAEAAPALAISEAPSAAGNEAAPAVALQPVPQEEAEEKLPSNVEVDNGVIKIAEPEQKEEPKTVEQPKPKSISNKESGAKETLSSSSKAAKTTSTASQKGGKFYVQLGAFSSMHALDKSWKEISTKHKSSITGGKLVNKIERGGKTLYSLGFGPYKQRLAATEACNKLKAKGQDCIVKE